jgi:monoamine oxidase
VSDEKTGSSRGRWTRRQFVRNTGLGALAATGLARGSAALGAEQGAEEQPPASGSSPSSDYDAIVLGAGFAGVTAARELRMNGLRVLLLEARPRIGGRTFTSEVGGHQVELGAAFVHWTQPHVWAEITRYGLEIDEAAITAPPRSAWLTSGERREGSLDDFSLLAFRGAGAFFFDAMQMVERPHDQLFVPGIAEVDRLSVTDRLDGLRLPEDQRDIMDAILATSCHCSPSEAGLVEMLRWYTLPGATLQAYVDSVGRYWIRGGTKTLIEGILADGRPELRLSTPVKAVRQQDDQVVVTTEGGETVSARAVVVTLPLNVLGQIDFSPPLSSGKRAVASEGHAGSGVKLHIQVRGQLGGFNGLAPWPAPLTSLQTEFSDPEATVLTAFGPSGKLLDINDDQAIQEAVRRLLPGAEVQWAVGYDWNADPYSRGTWCVFRPGQLTRYLRELQRPEGRVFYASGDNANGWRGFIDGAIESGLRASREVAAALG